jgi:hypothetical protein
MLLVGYCYGIRHERRLCHEVALHLAYRWFCKLDLDDKIPHHSTFSVNRLGRFRESEILRHIFERVVAACMVAGLVKGEGFAVGASVMEANASRYHGKAQNELDWTDAQRQKRAVAEYLAGFEAEAHAQEDGTISSDGTPTATPDRKSPKVISPSDLSSAWTAWAGRCSTNPAKVIRTLCGSGKAGGFEESLGRDIVSAFTRPFSRVHLRCLRRTSFLSEAGLFPSTVRIRPKNSKAATGQ